MASPDPLADVHQGFLVECDDLLEIIHDGLIAIEGHVSTRDTINDMFRAVHSIKGGAGAFNYDGIVRFAHGFETALEGLRDQTTAHDRASEPNILRYLFRAADGLTDLIAAAHDGATLPPDAGHDALAELIRLTQGEAALAESCPQNTQTFQIRLLCDPDAYRFEIDLRTTLQTLAQLGSCETTCLLDPDRPVTALAQMEDVSEPVLLWDITLKTNREIADLEACLAPITPMFHFQINGTGHDEAESDFDIDDLGLFSDRPKPAKRPSLRVDLERLEKLVNQVGEMVIAQSMLAQTVSDADLPRMHPINSRFETLNRLTRDIQDSVVMIRAQPIKPLFQRMSRVLRDAAEDTGKEVTLRLEGEDTEIDKIVLERLVDPLTHMVRNAVVHGIESPETRQRTGKPKIATLTLRAAHRAGLVIVEIIDDGRGVDQAKVIETARSQGISVAEDASSADIFDLLFLPGFSTSPKVDDLSGRGVGLDVVRDAITSMGGRIVMSSTTGQSTRLSLSLPLTLAVLDGLIVRQAQETFVLPLNTVHETLSIDQNQLHRIGQGQSLLTVRGMALPHIALSKLIGSAHYDEPENTTGLIVGTTDGGQVVLAVDQIVDQRQIVIKGLPPVQHEMSGVSGATILGDGQVALIIEPTSLLAQHRQLSTNFKSISAPEILP